VIADEHHLTRTLYTLQQAVRLAELRPEPHVGQVAGHDDHGGIELIELVYDAVRQTGDVVARATVQVRDLRDDDRFAHDRSSPLP